MAITDACENPEVLTAWVDQFYTEAGGTLAWLGVENETYKINEKGEGEWIIGNEYGDTVDEVHNKTVIQGAQNHSSV